jgi:hypothetical protein
MTDLHALADQVTDEPSFVQFLSALAADWDAERTKAPAPSPSYGRAASGWQNATIRPFLEAAAAWATTSSRGLQFQRHSDNPWRRCAHILLAGRFYE